MREVSTVQQRKHQYPGVAEAERQRSNYKRVVDDNDEPDILHTAGGYCPNYEKFYRMGYKDDYEILCRCNLD